MLLTKQFIFHASHQLTGALNEPLHGHSYKLQVTVKGNPNKDGIVIDFHELKRIVIEKAINKLDHSHLNDTIKQPTAENIAIWIWDKLNDDKRFNLYKVKLWETENSFVTYNGE